MKVQLDQNQANKNESALERSITLPFAGVGRQTLIIRLLSGDEMAVDGNKRKSSSTVYSLLKSGLL